VVICLEQGADLHTAQLMSLPLRLVLPFWYRVTWVVPEKGPLDGCVCERDQTHFIRPYYPLYTTTTTLHPINGPFSGTTWVSQYHKGKTNLDFTEARDSEWQWYHLGHMQVCTLLQTDNHASTPPLSFLQTGCPSCRPTNSVKALKSSLIYEILSLPLW